MWARTRRLDAELAHIERDDAKQEAARSEERRQDVERLVARSRSVTADLRRELDKNGFTELFQQAMRRRGA